MQHSQLSLLDCVGFLSALRLQNFLLVTLVIKGGNSARESIDHDSLADGAVSGLENALKLLHASRQESQTRFSISFA